MPRRFEYQFLRRYLDFSPDEERSERLLNEILRERGADGWELVSAQHTVDTGQKSEERFNREVCLYFRRSLSDDSDKTVFESIGEELGFVRRT